MRVTASSRASPVRRRPDPRASVSQQQAVGNKRLATCAFAPWLDIGYEVYTAEEPHNKGVLRAGLRVRFQTP